MRTIYGLITPNYPPQHEVHCDTVEITEKKEYSNKGCSLTWCLSFLPMHPAKYNTCSSNNIYHEREISHFLFADYNDSSHSHSILDEITRRKKTFHGDNNSDILSI